MDEIRSRPAPGNARTVQEYIDELPVWSDGTQLKSTPMTGMQWRIWSLAAAGKFFEGFVVFMAGVTLPLIAREFHIAPAEKGLVSSASLAGILVGAMLLGGLSDYFGRKRMFIAEMIIFCAFLALLILCGNFISLVICLFGVGMALGCDYPTAHMIISESIPSVSRGRLVLGAFAFQAVGAMCGTGVGAWCSSIDPSLERLALDVCDRAGARRADHARPLLHHRKRQLADRARRARRGARPPLARLLHRKPRYPQAVALARHVADERACVEAILPRAVRRRNLRATIFASVPWFIQDLGTYGIGIFTPTILVAAALGGGPDKVRSLTDMIADGILSAKGSALITSLLIVGILFAIVLADRSAASGCRSSASSAARSGSPSPRSRSMRPARAKIVLIFAGFMLFNFMTNLGPNAQTYLLAGEVFPTEVRGMGAGFAAMFAKIGAVATAFLFPILLAGIGTARAALRAGRHLAARRGRHLDLPHRNDRRES